MVHKRGFVKIQNICYIGSSIKYTHTIFKNYKIMIKII